jgi:hypothetical protein
MIPKDVVYLGTPFGHCKNTANHVGMFLWPVNLALQFPDINDVANQIELITLIVLQEMTELAGLRTLGPKMNI